MFIKIHFWKEMRKCSQQNVKKVAGRRTWVQYGPYFIKINTCAYMQRSEEIISREKLWLLWTMKYIY